MYCITVTGERYKTLHTNIKYKIATAIRAIVAIYFFLCEIDKMDFAWFTIRNNAASP